MSTTEALAILRGCELAMDLGHRSVIIESDSKAIISSLSPSLGESFQDCRWSWVPRSANITEDTLALRRSTKMCNITWVCTPPSSLVHVLNKDGLPCPP
ncbi:unnamed protein product [Malus baccata var. baccata]